VGTSGIGTAGTRIGATVAAVCLALFLLGLTRAGDADAAPNAVEATSIGSQAYEHGFPLLEILRVRREMASVACPDGKGNAPINSFSHARQFAGVDDRTVVAPNTDTLYSVAHLDLRKGPVTITNPRMGKRYYSFALLDPWSNVIDIPGLREDGGGAGSYTVRWTGGPRETEAPRGDRVIRSKYRRVWVIGRTLATDRADQRKAYRLMRRYSLLLPTGKERKFDPDCEPGEPEKLPTPSDGAEFVELLNGAMERNPAPARDARMLAKLAPYGIGPGLSPEDAGLRPDVLAALYAGVEAEAQSLPTTAKAYAVTEAQKSDGWFVPPSHIGDYGTDYRFRAIIAAAGLGANTPEEAIYPTGLTDGDGLLYTGINDYRLTFEPGEEPPADYFWSLTMYDLDGYLVPNEIDRYSLGPSHPPLIRKPDGSIVIAIQHEEPTEEGVNWLPAPSGLFRLNLRLYGPHEEALNGEWKPPPVERLTGGIG
jgi:hypothetical protein